jgi:hypothetical protein
MGILIGLIIAAVFLFVAISRKSSSSLNSKPQRSESVTTTKSIEEALRLITSFASSSGYKVSHFEPESGQLVLEEGTSMTSYGFFYPISVISNGAGGSLVQIGVKSRAFQVGPVVGRSLDKVVNGIKAALF